MILIVPGILSLLFSTASSEIFFWFSPRQYPPLQSALFHGCVVLYVESFHKRIIIYLNDEAMLSKQC